MQTNMDTANQQMLNTLLEIKMILKEIADGRARREPLRIQVDGGDRALHDLVNKVIEELLIRVRNENILTITNG
ncbi:MAG: hypothetical protein HZA04_06115 [Nitrospinae bacterium]|nr:hypothetical protein [Nitrospinota bacterium]